LGRFLKVWSALQPRQRLIATLAFAAMIAAVIGLVQMVRAPSMAPLYSGLDATAAGEVASAVEGMGVSVRMEGGAIMVPAADRDRLRMALAAQGLPRSGPAGYEILDGLDGFGTTSEMFEATYWRALEGELARTILATPGVRAARVHVASPAGRPFQRAAQPSASVTVTMGNGALSTANAEAIRYLVASAVAGLDPARVSVIDAAYGAVLRPGEDATEAGGQLPGASREAQLRGEIERLLAARVGVDRAIVTVSVDTDMQSETVVERVIDPDTRIPISTETREIEETATGGTGGAATVASNLPQGGDGEGGQPSQSARTEAEERINYEVSQLTRERVKRPGEVRRITVAVLVDGVVGEGADGQRVWTPRPQEELDQLRDLVRSAIGYDEARGDVVTVETLEFAPRPQTGAVAEAGMGRFLQTNAMSLIQTLALAAVALGLALFVLRPLLAIPPDLEPVEEGPERLPPPLIFGDGGEAGDGEEKDGISRLRDLFAEQKDDSANVLRSWLERDLQQTVDSDSAEDGR
jgi:flagellar M-ring protein FliF